MRSSFPWRWYLLPTIVVVTVGSAWLLNCLYRRPPDAFIATAMHPYALALRGQGSLLAVEHGPNRGIAFTNTRGQQVRGDGGTATLLYQVPAGAIIHTLPVSGTRGLAFDPTGTRLAILSVTGELSVWSVADEQRLTTVRHPLPNDGGLLAFTPDGERLTIFDGAQTSVYAWRSGTIVQTYPGCATFSPDGTLVAVSSTGRVGRTELRRVADGALVHTVGVKNCPQFVQHGTQLFGRSTEHRSETLLIDVATGRVAQMFRGMGAWDAASIDQHGQRVALGRLPNAPAGTFNLFAGLNTAHRAITVWDLTTGQQLATLDGPRFGTNTLAWSPDGRWLATVDAPIDRDSEPGIRLWDMSRRGWLGWW